MKAVIAALLGLVLAPFLASCSGGEDKVAAANGGVRHIIYVHGKIVEDQGREAVSPQYGRYEFDAILERFRALGFEAEGEVRPAGADAETFARRTVERVEALMAAGAAPEEITIVGASKGAYIAALASHFAQNRDLKFVLLAGCNPGVVDQMIADGVDLYGDIIAIRDIDDTELAGSCEPLFRRSPGIGEWDDIVVETHLSHGLLYRPLDAWVLPTADWARR